MNAEKSDFLARYWKSILFVVWIVASGYFLFERWQAIHWFALGDTDDNMRIMQVRTLMQGQDWYDLRQYRLDPPHGANMHWSHFVDLPIVGIILLTKPFFGALVAERIAVALAPLIPLGVAMTGLGLTARRLVAPGAYLLSAGIMLCFVTAMTMFMPLRIDHHGWQLALLTLVLAGLADPQALRGGLTIGIASALSLVIGLETLPWLAIAGGGVALRWIIALEQSPRMRGYGLALGGGVTLGFLVFSSRDNWVARCDALTPVWLSSMLLASALIFLIGSLRVENRGMRFLLTALVGVMVAVFFAVAWPQCVGRPEQISPELERLWFNNISEVKPIYTRNWPTILSTSVLVIGLFGSFWALWKHWKEDRGAAWATIALLSLGSGLLVLWQTRAAPSALLFSVTGATAIGWNILVRARNHSSIFVRVFGTFIAFLLVSGLAVQLVAGRLPNPDAAKPGMKRVNRANASCATIPSMRPIGALPKATVLTFVDLGPRLITITHHDAIAGPYHRNGDAILDIQHAFRGTPEDARKTARKHGASLLLICPNMSESTIYKSQAPKGFYMQLIAGKIPAWLEPVPLPANSPFMLWRIKP
ncbi:AcrB/AcrD/AcrF family protein [Aquisediminimonas profunda]|uniref:AcrB/AcrD/AcrF family protein n=1 Tax=Aquisediminimonas profunda TaxID=1550733 RepID=UPI001C626266|nr:AcrB/AcrD/AcrF family protein [Aquisediminimonas profunda]